MQVNRITKDECTGLVLDRSTSKMELIHDSCPKCTLWRSWTIRSADQDDIDYLSPLSDTICEMDSVNNINPRLGIYPWWSADEAEEYDITPNTWDKYGEVVFWLPDAHYIPMCRRIYHYLCKFNLDVEDDGSPAENTYTFEYGRTSLKAPIVISNKEGGGSEYVYRVDGTCLVEVLSNYIGTSAKNESEQATQMAEDLTINYKFLSFLKAQLDAGSRTGETTSEDVTYKIPEDENPNGCVYVDELIPEGESGEPVWLCNPPYRNPCAGTECCTNLVPEFVRMTGTLGLSDGNTLYVQFHPEYMDEVTNVRISIASCVIKDANGDIVPNSEIEEFDIGVLYSSLSSTTYTNPDDFCWVLPSEIDDYGCLEDIVFPSKYTSLPVTEVKVSGVKYIVLQYLRSYREDEKYDELTFDIKWKITPIVNDQVACAGIVGEMDINPESGTKNWDEDFNCNNLDGHTIATKPTDDNDVMKKYGKTIWSLFYTNKMKNEDTSVFNGYFTGLAYSDPIPRYGTPLNEAPFVQSDTGRWVRCQHEPEDTTEEAYADWVATGHAFVYYRPYDAYVTAYGEPPAGKRFDFAWVVYPEIFPSRGEEFMVTISAVHYRWDIYPLFLLVNTGDMSSAHYQDIPATIEYHHYQIYKDDEGDVVDCTVTPPDVPPTECTLSAAEIYCTSNHGTLLASSHYESMTKAQREAASSLRCEPMVLVKCPSFAMINAYNDETGGAGLSGEWQTSE